MLDDEAGTVGAIIDQLRQASARNLASGRKKPIKKDSAKKPKQQSWEFYVLSRFWIDNK